MNAHSLVKLFVALSLVLPVPALAQTAAQSEDHLAPISTASLTPLPSDPIAVMASAKQLNGFDESGAKGWHVRATYDIYDAKGALTESGVYEELWSSPTRYRRSYTGTKFTQTDYASAKGLYRSGDQQWPPAQTVGLVRRLLITPLDYPGIEPETSLVRDERSIGQVRFVCVAQKPKNPSPYKIVGVPEQQTYKANCFMPQTPVVRVALLPRSDRAAMWNNFGLFEGRYVPRDIVVMERGKKKLTIHLDSAEEVKSPDEAFAPAANAKGPIAGPIEGPSGIAYQVHSEAPMYPPLARNIHIQGDVTMQVTVGEDGSVTDVKVQDGPGILRPGTVEAVRKWRYEPMLIMGKPVEMSIEVVVHYASGSSISRR